MPWAYRSSSTVQNHVADVNPWFLAAINPRIPATLGTTTGLSGRMSTRTCSPTNTLDGDAVIWACKNYACYHQIFGASMPELNFTTPRCGRDEAHRRVLDPAGADGYRLDAAKHIVVRRQ